MGSPSIGHGRKTNLDQKTTLDPSSLLKSRFSYSFISREEAFVAWASITVGGKLEKAEGGFGRVGH